MKAETKEKTVLESNKLIAEFMGDDIMAATSENLPRTVFSAAFKSFKECEVFCESINIRSAVLAKYQPIHHRGKMKYHSSWDWIMLVVDKIDSGLAGNFATHIKSSFDWDGEKYNTVYKMTVMAGVQTVIDDSDYHSTRIDAVYKTVVAFIEWYNENKGS